MKFLIVLPAVFFLAYAGHSGEHRHQHAPAARSPSADAEVSAVEAEKSAIEGGAEQAESKRGVVSTYGSSRPNSYSNSYPVVSSSYQSAASYVQPSHSYNAPSNSYSPPAYNSPSNSYNPPSNSYNPPAASSYSSSNSYSSHTGYLSVCQKRLNLLHNINKELSEAIAASQGHCANVVTLTNATAQVDILLVNSCGGGPSSLYGAKSAAV